MLRCYNMATGTALDIMTSLSFNEITQAYKCSWMNWLYVRINVTKTITINYYSGLYSTATKIVLKTILHWKRNE